MDFESFNEKSSILTLPIEARFMIYDSLVTCNGTLVIFANYELTKNVDKQTIDLLHVNRTIRAEVQEYFYRNQTFQFRSFRAMENFLDKVGPYYAGIIRYLELGSWLAQRSVFSEEITPMLQRLKSVEYLTIIPPAHGFVTEWSSRAELGEKAITLLCVSEKLAKGRIYLVLQVSQGRSEIRFVPRTIEYPTTETKIINKAPTGFNGPMSWYDRPYTVHYIEVDLSEYLGISDKKPIANDGMGGVDRPVEVSSDEESMFADDENSSDVIELADLGSGSSIANDN